MVHRFGEPEKKIKLPGQIFNANYLNKKKTDSDSTSYACMQKILITIKHKRRIIISDEKRINEKPITLFCVE